MAAPYTGRCACGAVTLQLIGEPIAARQCWCRQCQRIAAGGPTTNAVFRVEDVTVSGNLASTAYDAASGNTLTSYFCPSCGSHVYCQSSAFLWRKTVRFGVIDEPHGLRPDTAIWVSEAPDWAVIDPGLERFPGQAPVASAPGS